MQACLRACALAVNNPNRVVAGLSAATYFGMPLATIERRMKPELLVMNACRQIPNTRCHILNANSSSSTQISSTTMQLGSGSNYFLTTTYARTALDCARWHGAVHGVVTLDFLLHNNLATMEEVLLERQRMYHVHGSEELGDAIAIANGMAESPRESEALYAMVAAGLPQPDQQVQIRTPTGDFIARVDFCFRDVRLIVEYDGKPKLQGAYGISPETAALREVARSRALNNAGYTIRHLTAENFRDGSGIALIVAEYHRLRRQL